MLNHIISTLRIAIRLSSAETRLTVYRGPNTLNSINSINSINIISKINYFKQTKSIEQKFRSADADLHLRWAFRFALIAGGAANPQTPASIGGTL